MTAMLLVLLLAQASDPRIVSVERLVGDARRPYHWAPLAVTVKSDAGFDGDLEARSSLGIRVVRRIRVPAGGVRRVQLPAIDPQRISAGGASTEAPGANRTPDRVVLVDARLSFASELASSEGVLVRTAALEDLTWLCAQGLLDACDLLLLKDASGLSVGSVRAWSVVSTREEAEKAIAAPEAGGAPVLLVDPDLWTLAPEGGWVPAKKDWTLIFAALYAFAAFGALVFASRKGPRAMTVAIAVVAGLGVLAFLGFFPRKHLWVLERSCEAAPPAGEAAEVRLWFAGAGATLAPTLDFPRVVKPVYPRLSEAEEPLTLRIEEGGGCRVEEFTLPAGRKICFASVSGRAPSMRPEARPSRPLYRAFARRSGQISLLGDLAAGAELPAGGGASPPGEDAEARVWLRLVEGDALIGRLEPRGGPSKGVGSPDLADARQAAPLFLQRLK